MTERSQTSVAHGFPLNAASRRGDPLTPNFPQSPRNKPIKGLGQQANTSITYSNKEHVARSSNTSSASLLLFLISPSVQLEKFTAFACYSELNDDPLMWPPTMKWLAGFWHVFLYLERLDGPLTSEIRVVWILQTRTDSALVFSLNTPLRYYGWLWMSRTKQWKRREL